MKYLNRNKIKTQLNFDTNKVEEEITAARGPKEKPTIKSTIKEQRI